MSKANLSAKVVTRTAPQAGLDPLTFPFKGSRLIEASAGTGKTWTIAALYVRLVLGHGADEHRFVRPLTPPEILVVTYTEAATKELRDRIRARLAVAADYFQLGEAAPEPGDRFLADLRRSYPPGEWPACVYRLQLAAESMDEAAVSTIHSWCNRMLREHAFDSGSLFTQKLEADQSELLAEVVRDYWRNYIVPLGPDEAAEIATLWNGPAGLQKGIKDLLDYAEQLPHAGPPIEVLRAVIDERAETLQRLKKPWGKWADDLQQKLDAARGAKAFDGSKLRQNYYTGWLSALKAWHDDPTLLAPAITDTAYERLSRDGMATIWKKGKPLDHPAFVALADLRAELAKLIVPVDALKSHATREIAKRFAAEQERRSEMGFDELLTRLDAVLQGDNGPRLAQRIREKFPAALIDEFQDTDPVQYRIFDAVYDVGANRTDVALALIGDPKQAIYAFRGADIYTYLKARRDCADRLHTLARNFRSTKAMVKAVNAVFADAETRDAGKGAFLFRTDAGNPVPFVEAVAEGRKESFVAGKAMPPALTAWWLPGDDKDASANKKDQLALMGAACATEMVRLLNLGQAGKAGFAEDGAGVTQPLRPRDMAVLVNNRTEAAAIRKALAARGVRSVYLSDRDSVYDSAQAGEIQLWLEACAEPDDARRLRAALATATLGLDWNDIERLNRDELLWEEHVLQFRRYRDVWRRQGVLPMLRRLLQDFGVPGRLLAPEAALGGGERVLTDLLHLAELLQQAAAVLDGEHALIRHLAEQRASIGQPGGSEDARLIRLESDADLVQVVTIFKSKGLEYPLVFLPFAWTLRAVKANDCPIKQHDESGRLQVLLSGYGQALAKADHERLGEDLRKLYVALTRARHATWVGLAATEDFGSSAFGYLLNGGAAVTAEDLGTQLQQLATLCPSIQAAQAPNASDARFVSENRAAARGSARTPVRAARENWWIASYSALKTVPTAAEVPAAAAGADRAIESLHVPDTAREDTFRESALGRSGSDDTSALSNRSAVPQRDSMHAFPRGAEVGTFLHDLLEWAADTGFAAVASQPDALRDTIARRCARRGWNAWIEPMTSWARDFLTTDFALPAVPLQGATSFRLATLEKAVPEMEFWIAAGNVDAIELDRLVRAHTLDAAERTTLAPALLNGMLKGFIDLVLEHDGRYFVADYKSNWLGSDDAAYSTEAMRDAILANRYELQYTLYLLALHRLLKTRLPDYDYDRHVGGAVYLFLRGCRASGNGVHFERPPRALIEALDRLFARAAEDDASRSGPNIEVTA